MEWRHVALLVASFVGAGATAVLKIDPELANYLTPLLAVCGSVVTYTGLTSSKLRVGS